MASASSDHATMAAWDAVETRERIRKKDVSAEEVVEAAIARAEDARRLGAVFERAYDRARANAARGPRGSAVGRAHVHQGPGADPWRAHDVGLTRRRPVRLAQDDPIAARLEEAGLVTLGKSACPELGLTATTEPLGWPPCRNPWDPSRSTGGSSGGAATLVAAGVVPIAHGTTEAARSASRRLAAASWGSSPRGFASTCRGEPPARQHRVRGRRDADGARHRGLFAALESRRAPRSVAPIGPVAEKPAGPLRIGVFVDAPTARRCIPTCGGPCWPPGASARTLGHEVEEIACPFEGEVIDDFLRILGLRGLGPSCRWGGWRCTGGSTGRRSSRGPAGSRGTSHARSSRAGGDAAPAPLHEDVRAGHVALRRARLAHARRAGAASRLPRDGLRRSRRRSSASAQRGLHVRPQCFGRTGARATAGTEPRRFANRSAARQGCTEGTACCSSWAVDRGGGAVGSDCAAAKVAAGASLSPIPLEVAVDKVGPPFVPQVSPPRGVRVLVASGARAIAPYAPTGPPTLVVMAASPRDHGAKGGRVAPAEGRH